MTYDFIIMNPPYNVGNKITSAAISSCDKCVCLMPLSQYKSNELYRHVDKMELADPEMFDDADITNNLCICTLMNKTVDKFKTYEDMEMVTRDENFFSFYIYNKQHKTETIQDILINTTIKENWNVQNTFMASHRIADCTVGVQGEKSWEYKYNVLETMNISEVPHMAENVVRAFVIAFKDHTCKENFVTWWYYNKKVGLAHKSVVGLRSAGTIKDCIPQIDWETISDTPLWKEGKYDEAILSAMGLKWDGDVIVEERKL